MPTSNKLVIFRNYRPSVEAQIAGMLALLRACGGIQTERGVTKMLSPAPSPMPKSASRKTPPRSTQKDVPQGRPPCQLPALGDEVP